jgi:hypothetical protein
MRPDKTSGGFLPDAVVFDPDVLPPSHPAVLLASRPTAWPCGVRITCNLASAIAVGYRSALGSQLVKCVE